MAFVRKTLAPEQIEAARRLYQDPQTSLDDVAASLGITRRTLDAQVKEWVVFSSAETPIPDFTNGL
jgi:hypothetical protein